MNELNDLSNSLEATIKDADLQNMTIDLAESVTDSLLKDGIIRDIPILGTIVGLAKSALNLRDRLFLKKIIYFLANLTSVDQDIRHKMISEIDSSDNYKIKVGEKLLYIIDKCEDHRTAAQLGKLFCAFLKGAISYSEFLRASVIIDKVFSEDLEFFLKESLDNIQKTEGYNDDPLSEFQHRLVNAGICSTYISPINVRDQDDWKMSERYVVEGGTIGLYVTEIGVLIKTALT